MAFIFLCCSKGPITRSGDDPELGTSVFGGLNGEEDLRAQRSRDRETNGKGSHIILKKESQTMCDEGPAAIAVE